MVPASAIPCDEILICMEFTEPVRAYIFPQIVKLSEIMASLPVVIIWSAVMVPKTVKFPTMPCLMDKLFATKLLNCPF